MRVKLSILLIFFSAAQFFVQRDLSCKENKYYLNSNGYVLRQPDYKNISKYKKQKEFIYDEVKAPVSLWDEIKVWIWNKVFNFLIFN